MERQVASLTSAQRALVAPEFERFVLPNGLTVLLKGDGPHPVASVQLWIRSGSVHEGRWLGTGLSHYLEHMVFKGTAHWDGPALSQEAQALGGTLNAYTTFDRTVYHLDGPAESAPRFAELLRELAFQPRLDPADAREEKDVILREIDMGHDDPDHRLSEAFFGAFYRTSPFRFPIIGMREFFRALTPEDISAYHRERYSPGNAVLVVAGSFDHEVLRPVLCDLFGEIPPRPAIEPVQPAEAPQLSRREVRLTGDFRLARAQMGFRIPAFHHAGAPALDLLGLVLGGGRSSVLWEKLRDEAGLVHEIHASAWNPDEPGVWGVSFLSEPAKLENATQAIKEMLRQPELITAAAVARARQMAWRQEVNRRRTASGVAARLGVAETVEGDHGFAARAWERLLACRAEDLQRVAAKTFHDEQSTLVTLGPPAKAGGARRSTSPRALASFEREVLPNGVRLLTQHDPSVPKAHLRVTGLGAASVERPGERGITALLATLLTRDTADCRASEVAAQIDEKGASFNAFCGNNSFGLSLEALAESFRGSLPFLESALKRASFVEATVAREREAQLAELADDEDDVVTYAQRQLRAGFFGTHPLAHPSLGVAADVAQLTPDVLRVHAEKLLVGENLVFSLAGDFSEADLEAVREVALTMPGGRAEVAQTDSPETPAQAPAEIVQPREQAVVLHGFPDVGVGDTALAVGEILQEMANDMGGHLFVEVREKRGLAYFVGAGRLTGLTTGLFTLYAGTAPEHVAEVRRAFAAELARWREGKITPEELARARRRLVAGRLLHHQLSGARALEAALNELYGLGCHHGEGYRERLEAVTLADLQAFAQRWLDPARGYALTVRPGKA